VRRCTVYKTVEFAAGHFLPNHRGKCQNIHGHNYKLEVGVRGKIQESLPSNAESGMVLDFKALSRIVDGVAETFDHAFINEHAMCDDYSDPTAENMCWWIFEELNDTICNTLENCELFVVRLWEASNSYAEVTLDDFLSSDVSGN